jgi:hypothetical protein
VPAQVERESAASPSQMRELGLSEVLTNDHHFIYPTPCKQSASQMSIGAKSGGP